MQVLSFSMRDMEQMAQLLYPEHFTQPASSSSSSSRRASVHPLHRDDELYLCQSAQEQVAILAERAKRQTTQQQENTQGRQSQGRGASSSTSTTARTNTMRTSTSSSSSSNTTSAARRTSTSTSSTMPSATGRSVPNTTTTTSTSTTAAMNALTHAATQLEEEDSEQFISASESDRDTGNTSRAAKRRK